MGQTLYDDKAQCDFRVDCYKDKESDKLKLKSGVAFKFNFKYHNFLTRFTSYGLANFAWQLKPKEDITLTINNKVDFMNMKVQPGLHLRFDL